MRTSIWQLLPKEANGAQHQTCLVSSVATSTTVSRQTVYIRLGHIGLYARRPADVFHLPQLTVACDYPGVDSMHCRHHNSGLV
ncbi:hypothetical protein TNCV_947721 [Trichonephila clavipes]|nr:hypothetical protein TNCV_947721 [Trichonephila clavipes]